MLKMSFPFSIRYPKKTRLIISPRKPAYLHLKEKTWGVVNMYRATDAADTQIHKAKYKDAEEYHTKKSIKK